jgi:hypothetical protein
MIIDNAWYGHRHELLSYIGEEDKIVYAFIAHGSYLIWELPEFRYKGRISAFHPILVWTELEERNMKKNGAHTVVATGAPFLYAVNNYKQGFEQEKKARKKLGTIVFPQHTVPGSRPDELYNKYLIEIVRYTEVRCPPPYQLSLPAFDHREREWIQEKIGSEWSIVSFGDRISKDFLRNFISVVEGCEFAVVESTSSSAYYYALFLGLQVFILHDKTILESNIDRSFGFKRSIREDLAHLVNKSVLSFDEGRYLSSVVLGEPSFRSRAEIRSLLGIESPLKMMAAELVTFLTRLRYSYESRAGKDDVSINNTMGTGK